MCFGLWWTFCTYWIHLTSKSNSKTRRQKSSLLSILDHDTNDPLARKSWIPQPFLKKVPLEPIGKTLLPSLGVLVELFVDVRFDKGWGSHVVFYHYTLSFVDGHFRDLNRFYHICLYSTFIMSGIIDYVSNCPGPQVNSSSALPFTAKPFFSPSTPMTVSCSTTPSTIS